MMRRLGWWGARYLDRCSSWRGWSPRPLETPNTGPATGKFRAGFDRGDGRSPSPRDIQRDPAGPESGHDRSHETSPTVLRPGIADVAHVTKTGVAERDPGGGIDGTISAPDGSGVRDDGRGPQRGVSAKRRGWLGPTLKSGSSSLIGVHRIVL